MNAMKQADLRLTGGMLPIHWNLTDAQPERDRPTHLSVGAQADSAHEYLLKQYLMTAKTDKESLEMCTFTDEFALQTLSYPSC